MVVFMMMVLLLIVGVLVRVHVCVMRVEMRCTVVCHRPLLEASKIQ